MHQAITLIAVILRVFSKLAMENVTHPFSRVQNAAHYSGHPTGGWNGPQKCVRRGIAKIRR
jgi:hypothetical protein